MAQSNLIFHFLRPDPDRQLLQTRLTIPKKTYLSFPPSIGVYYFLLSLLFLFLFFSLVVSFQRPGILFLLKTILPDKTLRICTLRRIFMNLLLAYLLLSPASYSTPLATRSRLNIYRELFCKARSGFFVPIRPGFASRFAINCCQRVLSLGLKHLYLETLPVVSSRRACRQRGLVGRETSD